MRLPSSTTHPRLLSAIILILLTLIWGSSFILMKKGLIFYSSDEVAALRIFTASLFLLPFAISWIKLVPRQLFFLIFISGLLGSLIPAFLFAIAQTKLESAVTGIINSLTPVFVILVGAALFGQKISLKMIIGLFLALTGTTALMYAGGGDDMRINYFAGFVVAATIMYGFNVNILKFRLSGISPIAVASISIVLCSPLVLIHLLFFTDFLTTLKADGAMLALGYLSVLGVIGTGLALILFNYLIRIASPLFASSVTYLIPIVAVFWGIMDGEKLGIIHYASMLIVVGGVYIANKK